MKDYNIPTRSEYLMMSKTQQFMYGLYELYENWYKERNLHTVMIGNHLTREECLAIVQYDCCISHSKFKSDPRNTEWEYEIDKCYLLQHIETCNYKFDDLDGCSQRLSILMDLQTKMGTAGFINKMLDMVYTGDTDG